MPVTRKFLAQDQEEENQILKMDSANRFIVNAEEAWQFLFGPNSVPEASTQVLKISAKLDSTDLNSVKFIAYLYNPITGGIDSGGTCTLTVYRVKETLGWEDELLGTFNGTIQPNSYFLVDSPLSGLSPADLDGGDSLMVEVVITRLSSTYRDRIYLNHLGIYDSFVRLRKDVKFLEITKKDE